MKASVIYEDTISGLRNNVRRLSHQGGQWSGKTVNILGALATLASEEGDAVTTVTSMSLPHLKGGALRDFELYCYPTFRKSIIKYHKTDHIFTFRSGHILEFKVFDTEFDARGPKRKRLFVNEANKYDYMTYWQLDSRSEQSIIDFNPTIEFWAHEHYKNDGETKWYYSDHRDNPFLSDKKHLEIENICIFKRDDFGNVVKDSSGNPIVERGNYDLWKVYARGLTGNVTGIIFPDWKMIDKSDFPENDRCEWIFSIDFGYTNDPTAIVKIGKIADTLFIEEIAYETGLSPVSIKQLLVANGYKKGEPLYCEHDPDMIALLRNQGISAYPARKGQGSIKAGIELICSYNVVYPNTSRNLNRERSLYIWDTDKNTGKSLNTPVDRNNHLMDACRYGIYTKYLRNKL